MRTIGKHLARTLGVAALALAALVGCEETPSAHTASPAAGTGGAAPTDGLLWPLTGTVTAGYLYPNGQLHRALDISSGTGLPGPWTEDAAGNRTLRLDWRSHISNHGARVVAPCRSRVATVINPADDDAGATTGFGRHVVLEIRAPGYGTGEEIVLAHLNRIDVTAGQDIEAGAAVGVEGTTGESTGVHLHFEVRRGAEKLDLEALNGAGVGAPVTGGQSMPGFPHRLQASVFLAGTTATARLSWTSRTDGFTVEIAESSVDLLAQSATWRSAQAPASPYDWTGLDLGKTYYWRVARNLETARGYPAAPGSFVTPGASGGTTPPPSAQASLAAASPASLDFGLVDTGTTADRAFQIRNAGGGTLSGTVTASPPFAVVAGAGYALAAGQTQTVVVRYSPSTLGNSWVTALSSDNGGGASVSLSGAGAKPAAVANTGGIGLRLRTGPGLSAGILATMPEGTAIRVTSGPAQADGYTWWSVAGPYGNGWCAVAEWLLPISPAVGGSATVGYTGGTGLRLRDGPGTSYATQAIMAEGTSLSLAGGPVRADGYSWWAVSGPYGTGWCAVGDWLSPDPR